MMDWFLQLERRERVVIVTATIVAVLLLFWTLAWAPLRDGTAALDIEVADRSREVIDLKRAANLTTTSPVTVAGGDNAPVLGVLIEATARNQGLSSQFEGVVFDGVDVARVDFSNAPFDRLVSWLIELEQRHGLRVVSANFSRTGAAGLVSGDVRLDRS
jgi:general secretion pathway protein M